MVQVINRGPSLGANLGTALGTGLGEGLKALAENKMQEIQNQKLTNFLKTQPDFTEESAQALSVAPQFIQQAVLKNRGKSIGDLANLKIRKQNFQEQRALEPVLKAEAEDYKNNRSVEDTAERMLKNLQKNKHKFPGALVGNLPASAQSVLLRDKDVREYVADANSLVSALVSTKRGLPTNYKLKLEALSKADLSQPIETQEKILKNVIKRSKQATERQKFINSLKDQESNYPLDLRQRLVDYDISMKDPLENTSNEEDLTNYVGENVRGDDGEFYKWDKSQNRYRLAKRKA